MSGRRGTSGPRGLSCGPQCARKTRHEVDWLIDWLVTCEKLKGLLRLTTIDIRPDHQKLIQLCDQPSHWLLQNECDINYIESSQIVQTSARPLPWILTKAIFHVKIILVAQYMSDCHIWWRHLMPNTHRPRRRVASRRRCVLGFITQPIELLRYEAFQYGSCDLELWPWPLKS